MSTLQGKRASATNPGYRRCLGSMVDQVVEKRVSAFCMHWNGVFWARWGTAWEISGACAPCTMSEKEVICIYFVRIPLGGVLWGTLLVGERCSLESTTTTVRTHCGRCKMDKSGEVDEAGACAAKADELPFPRFLPKWIFSGLSIRTNLLCSGPPRERRSLPGRFQWTWIEPDSCVKADSS